MIVLRAAKSVISYGDSYTISTGGPVVSLQENSAIIIGQSSYISNPGAAGATEQTLYEGTSVIGVSDPLTNSIDKESGFRMYRVKREDTLSGIAKKFNITIDTIRSANSGIKSILTPGKDIIILPVQGALYSISPDDSIESIASKYGADQNLIKTYNPLYKDIFASAKGFLILPYVKSSIVKVAQASSDVPLPDLKNYFSLPVAGWNWGQLHAYNAVDIANKCGTPVVASADGMVVSDKDFGDGSLGWNNGYGIFVLIEHPNGTKTRYAHLSKALVKIGSPILRGEEIGLVGNTGSTHGPTGCHLHFEVIGAKNPFVLK